MDISHVQSLRVAFTPAHVQLATDGVFLALPTTRSTVGVWSLQDITCKPLELEGHRQILTSLTLGHGSVPKLLLSAAADYVIVWDLQHARQQLDKGEKIRGRVIGTTLGSIQYSCFSNDDSLAAVCSGLEVYILQTKRECVVATLEGHDGPVTAAEFCPHYSSTLVTISEDRTYKVWNLEDLSLVYQSPIISGSPFLSIAMSLLQPHVVLGAADGVVRVFDLTDGNGFRCLHQVDVSKIISKQKEEKQLAQAEPVKQGPVTISSRPSWKQGDKNTSSSDSSEPQTDSVEAGYTVLSLYYTYWPQGGSTRQTWSSVNKPAFLQNKSGIVKDLLNSAPMLLVGTPAGLLQVNARSLELCGFVDFQDPVMSTEDLQNSSTILNAAGCVNFSQGPDPSNIWCVVGCPFQNIVHLLLWKHTVTASGAQSGDTSSVHSSNTDGMGDLSIRSGSQAGELKQELTVLSSEAMLQDSPLKAELFPKQKDTAKERQPRDFVSSPQKGKIIDNQPLTFKTKIKSSGYTAQPRMAMFKPKTNMSKAKTPTKPRAKSSNPLAGLMAEYPMHSSAPTSPSMKLSVAERPTPVNCISVSDDGQYLACALANKSAQVFNVPLSGKGTSYTGHNHVVTNVDWSHDSNMILTSSDDKTAAMWARGQSEPVLTFDRVQHNFSADKDASKKDKENKPYLREVHFAQFYYMDKFVLLTSANKMYLYKFHIETAKNEVKRYLSSSKYKLVEQWPVEAQQISALSAINGFYSYIVMCAGSNKSVEVYDMNVGTRVRRMTDVHSRPVHAICQNEGSAYVSHQANAYDLFVTAAAGDCIKLWDLRTNRCVRRYEGHLNRVHPCGVALSPCGKFIATGSEDKCTYVYDIRTGTYIHKLMGHTDVVSDVTFHPLHPQMFTASLDGKLQLYSIS